jgi:hypothetical protein
MTKDSFAGRVRASVTSVQPEAAADGVTSYAPHTVCSHRDRVAPGRGASHRVHLPSSRRTERRRSDSESQPVVQRGSQRPDPEGGVVHRDGRRRRTEAVYGLDLVHLPHARGRQASGGRDAGRQRLRRLRPRRNRLRRPHRRRPGRGGPPHGVRHQARSTGDVELDCAGAMATARCACSPRPK